MLSPHKTYRAGTRVQRASDGSAGCLEYDGPVNGYCVVQFDKDWSGVTESVEANDLDVVSQSLDLPG